jgi:hypothetical protein
MKPVSILGAALVVASSALAQNVYSPPGIGSSEDGLYSYYFGRYAAMRYQMVDGHHTKPAVYKSVALRLDGRSHRSSTAMGRSWTNVTIALSKGDHTNVNRTFSANITGTPTRVFSGSVTWKSQNGFPTNRPATWGANGAVFPFGTGGTSSTYLHLSGDILVDTAFTGGKLANNATFSGTRGYSYYHDGPGSATSSSSGPGRYIPSTRLNRTSTMPCNDTSMTRTFGAYTYALATAYGGQYSLINYRNMLRWYSYSYYCGYNNPVIHGVGVSAIEPGVDLGTGCNKLHVGNLAATYGYVTLPQSGNSSGYTGYRYQLIPHNAAYVGIKAVVQGAFADSKDNSFKLTQAYEREIPGLMPKQNPNRTAVWAYSATATSGNITPSASFFYNPSLCWAQ